MNISRREALRELSALFAIPFVGWPERLADPLAGTIAEYQAGRARGDWTAAEITQQALDRANSWGRGLNAIDMLSKTALDEARASDTRLRRRALRGPLDGAPVFAKAIYDMNGLPTTGSNKEWAQLFPEIVHRDSIEVARMRAAGAVVLGKTAADDFAYHGNGTSSLLEILLRRNYFIRWAGFFKLCFLERNLLFRVKAQRKKLLEVRRR